ncbi:MAG: BNR-4 repeat-containing protein [Candidatus Hydrogenedentes bacterium]|nr:BNR-4 repeat-containing protein [Candidatus Hydrogenedentota bacterium]
MILGLHHFLFMMLALTVTCSPAVSEVPGDAAGNTATPIRVVEIDRGHSWVSPYWGYNAPKLVFDGRAYYTAGLWGAKPESAEALLYKYEGATWRKGAQLSNVYQPITMVVDRAGRLIIAHTEQSAPLRIYRSITPGDIVDLERLPSPPDMENAYYISIAIQNEVLFLAYISTPNYSMFLQALNLTSLQWTPSRLVCQGQTEKKPKTAWTYPILYPTEEGLHLVASNSPDGGEGNTYNQVWHLFYVKDAAEPSVCEMVADSPVGHNAFAMDFLADKQGRCHLLFNWNQHVYGDPLPAGMSEAGLYYAWRDPATEKWRETRLGPVSTAGFLELGEELVVVTAQNGIYRLNSREQNSETGTTLWEPDSIAGIPGFIDTLSRASGSVSPEGVALVMDSLLPDEREQSQTRILWSVIPEK